MDRTEPESLAQTVEEWDAQFARDAESWFFGREPSEMARQTAYYWRLLHGDRPARVLDLGCGEGRDAVHFARRGHLVTAVDGSEAGIRKTERLARENGVALASLLTMDVRDLSLTPDYDILFSNNCLQFLGAECLAYLRRLQEITPPGGLNAISGFTREAESLFHRTGLYRFDHNELKFHYRDWRLLSYAEEILWRDPAQNYLSFARIIAQKAKE